VGRLVSEVLPDLERRIPVDASRARLPTPQAVAPRLEVRVERKGTKLVVCPEIFYGDPPIARVAGDALVPLTSGKLAVRRDISDTDFTTARSVIVVGNEEIDPGTSAPTDASDAVSAELLSAIAVTGKAPQGITTQLSARQVTVVSIGSLVNDGFRALLVGEVTDSFRLRRQPDGSGLLLFGGSNAKLVGSINTGTPEFPSSGFAEASLKNSAERVLR